MFKKKYKKYNRILNRLTWLNACSSGISIATGISSVGTFATFIGIPVSAALGAASMTGAISSGIISVLTKKYQQILFSQTFATFIGLPVSVALGAASMTGSIASGIISVPTKKYQKKLKKVMRLIDIVTPALVVFERAVSGALQNGVIDEEEFNMLQTLHLDTLNELIGIDRRMEAEHRSLVEKSLLEEIHELKKAQGTRV